MTGARADEVELAEAVRAGTKRRPTQLFGAFACLDDSVRKCPDNCRKRLLLDSLLIHLNDDHHWSRERIAAWLAGEEEPVIF